MSSAATDSSRDATWQIETVDSEREVGFFTSIALDSSDNPQIRYLDGTNADLKCAYFDGTSWQIETVDSRGFVAEHGARGKHTSIALDSLDSPHISYWDGTNGDLKYAYFE